MLPDLNRVIEQVSKEKGIDRQIIVEALRDAMLSAAKRTYGPEKKIEAQWNAEIGEVELFEIRTVVDHVNDAENEVTLDEARRSMDPEAEVGDELLAKLPPEKFGRIAAQAAKQNIIQRVRDAERDSIFKEFKTRKGELATGTVQRFEEEHHRQPGARRRDPAGEGADTARALSPGRPHPRVHRRRRALQPRSADHPLAHAPGPADRAVPPGGAGDLRRHRRGEGRGARARRASEVRGHVARFRRRSRRRLRRHARHARAGGGAGATQREDRHRRVDGRAIAAGGDSRR